jgi:hypothetical protein
MKGQLPRENSGGNEKLDNMTFSPFSVNTLASERYKEERADARNEEADDGHQLGVAGLSLILGQVGTYFQNRTYADDIDVLSFSLYHLFCRIDYLYRTVLPDLLSVSSAPITEESSFEDLLRHQHIWTKLRTIKYTLNRLEPLCNLLGDATECMLDVLDMTGGATSVYKKSKPTPLSEESEQEWMHTLSRERLEQALIAVMESLAVWQESYNDLTLLVDHFSYLVPAVPELILLDEAFTIVLDSAGAIFGDILPSFQALSAGDDDAVATLLFDLMHQADQLLAQYDAVLEPLHALIEQFALKSNR